MTKVLTSWRVVFWLVLAALPLLSGCQQISYYYQSASGQLSLLKRAQPIDKLLQDDSTPTELKERLTYIKRVRAFASTDLALPDNRSYTRYADLERDYAVWNIVAAEPLRLVGKYWCYPIIGCQLYRGYFDKARATELAKTLETDYDVASYGVIAYSTLGWFADPVLNTFIGNDDAWVAGLIFHELSHQIVYVENDTMFNESFANAVEELGVKQWQLKNGGTIDLSYAEKSEQFTRELLAAKEALSAVYDDTLLTDAEKLAKKVRAFKTIEAKCNQIYPKSLYCSRYKEPNNAWLLLAASYDELKPNFIKLYECTEDNWQVFYEAVRTLAKYDKEERRTMLNKLLSDCRYLTEIQEDKK